MLQMDSWPGRLTVGTGILLALTVVALPLGQREPLSPPERSAPTEPAVLATWLGTSVGPRSIHFGDLGDGWEAVGPLELVEHSDGTARLRGCFRESAQGEGLLSLEARLGQSRFDREPGEGPAVYGDLEGVVQGGGSLRGALLRIARRDGGALDEGGRLAFGLEWLETPEDIKGAWSRRPQEGAVSMQYGSTAKAFARDLSLVLGCVDGELVLEAGGTFEQRSDGGARLEALLRRRGFSDHLLLLELDFDGGEGGEEYGACFGSLRGLGDLSGARVELRGEGPGACLAPWGGAGPPSSTLLAALTAEVRSFPEMDEHGLREGVRTGNLSARMAGSDLHFVHGGPEQNDSWRDGFVADLGKLGSDFVFEAGGDFHQRGDGSARLTGLLSRRAAPQTAFWLDLEFDGWELGPDGGAGFDLERGSLLGLRAESGRLLRLSAGGEGLRLGVGQGDSPTALGARGRFGFEDLGGSDLRCAGGSLELTFDLGRAWEGTAAVADARHAFQLEHLGHDFHFAEGGRLVQRCDGTALVSGVLAREAFPGQRFFLELELSGRCDTSNGQGVPLGSPNPRIEGEEEAECWTYFRGMRGTLVGLDDFDGARLAIEGKGPCFQLGLGAAGERDDVGAFAAFGVKVLEQPRGDLRISERTRSGELSLRLHRGVAEAADSAYAMPSSDLQGGPALDLPGVAEDFAFVDPGSFEEFPGGSACLQARLQSRSEPGLGFDLRLDFDGRFEGDAFELADRRLPSTAYAARGGPVDTELWHGYRRAHGLLVGTGELRGTVIEVDTERMALLVGLGASGNNIEYGASGLLELRLRSGPVGSPVWVPDYMPGAELRFALDATARD